MEATKVRGKDILIKQTPYTIFNAFSDLRRFTDNLPAQYKEKLTAEPDSIIAELQGFKLGVKVEERIPYSLVSLKEDGQSPFPFRFDFHLETVGLDSTLFHIELSAELNMMMKMMIGGKLQELVDKLSDQIELAMQGQMPDLSKVKPEDFS